MDFMQLQLSDELMKALGDAGYTEPSPIQTKAIPPVLAGRDVLACAQTGTGKTAAFALPTLQLLNGRGSGSAGAGANSAGVKSTGKGKRPIRCLVLTPTRELALQIFESFEKYGKYLPLKSTVIFGGVGQVPQVAALKAGVDILVATPGRLNDLIGQGYISLSNIEIFVLDEADRMLDMGFAPDVKRVIKQLPAVRQTLLFSATIPNDIAALANSILKDPVKVYATPVSSTVDSISQCVYFVEKQGKPLLLAELLRDSDIDRALVFTRTKHGADKVARVLTKSGVQAMAIHGNKSQTARQAALSLFKAKRIRVLVATDIAARGLDISELSHVFNFDIPNIPETYVHRIGRTGRAGHSGRAISFCMADERPFLADIERLIGFSVPTERTPGWVADAAAKAQPAISTPGTQTGKSVPKPHNTHDKDNNMQKYALFPQKQPNKQLKQGKQPAAKAQEKPSGQEKQISSKTPENSKTHEQPRAQEKRRPQQSISGPAQPQRQGKSARGPGESGKRPSPVEALQSALSGPAKNIVTKRPVWGAAEAQPAAPAHSSAAKIPQEPAKSTTKGEDDMSRNKRRRSGRGGKGTKPAEAAAKKPEAPNIPKNSNGVFDFSEAELSEDQAIQVIPRTSTETKYASFEDFLKDH